MFLLAGLVEIGYLLLEGFCRRVLLPGMALQAHEREEAVRLSVFRLAVRKAGESPKPPPVGSAGVGIIPPGQCLRGKGSKELRKHRPVFQPGLKVAGAGLDDGARVAGFVCSAMRFAFAIIGNTAVTTLDAMNERRLGAVLIYGVLELERMDT